VTVSSATPGAALLLKGVSTYEATTLFIDEAAAAFRRRGMQAKIVDLGPPADELAYLAQTVGGERFDVVFSVGLFAELRDDQGRDISQIVGAPLVVQYVDYPLSHYNRLNGTADATALLVVDPTHVDALRSVYGPERFRHVAFSPHGAVGEPFETEPDAGAFADGRPIPILFPGTFYKPGPPLWAGLDRASQRVFEAAVEIALTTEFTPALEAFDVALERHGGHLVESARAALRINAFAVHEQVRQHRRLQILEAADKAGLPIHLVGAGYDSDLHRFQSITHVGEGPLRNVAHLMRRARVVLNVNANFGQGSHERPLSAMLAGAVAATDYSRFYAQAFAADQIVQFRWTSLAADLDALGELLENPEALFAIASKGHARSVAEHRWDNRVDAILEAARAVTSPRSSRSAT
jgi:hypothetical protein